MRRHEPDATRRPGIHREHPIRGQMSEVARRALRRLRLDYLSGHHNSVVVLAVFSLINGFISIALMAAAAVITRAPFIFPSLGPTAFLFFHTPMSATAAPRNALIGHLIGAAAGYLALVVFGLTDAGPAIAAGVTLPRVLAAGLSLGLTSGVMILCRTPHPPAGATTLIISLGILTQPWQLGVLMLAVLLLTVQAFVINRLAGIPYPVWAPRAQP